MPAIHVSEAVPPIKIKLLRASYMLAAVATLFVGWLAISGLLGELLLEAMKSEAGDVPPGFRQFFDGIRFAQGGLAIALTGVFAFLSFRPYRWGKVLCLWAAVSWGGFGLVMAVFGVGSNPTLDYIIAAACGMLAATVVLQVADPRFGG